jgi:glycerol uptake facilitator-like aquaporin
MFDLSVLQVSQKVRSVWAQAFSEWVAAFGLVATILLTLRARTEAVANCVGLYITAAYWFTASTSFANPAVTLARAFSDTFAGIRLADVPMFVVAQIVGGFCALAVVHLLTGQRQSVAASSVRSPAE